MVFGARAECCQHLGGGVRTTLVARARRLVSSTNLRNSRAMNLRWLAGPCVSLGLFRDAWRLHRAGHWDFRPKVRAVEGRAAVEYALWILGTNGRQAPPDTTRQQRVDALSILSGHGSRSPEALEHLLKAARDYGLSLERRDAILHLGGPAAEGVGAAVELLVGVWADPADPEEETAFFALLEAARAGEPRALDAICEFVDSLEGDENLRRLIFRALGEAAQVGAGRALTELVRYSRDRSEPLRLDSIDALPRRNALQELLAIAKAADDPLRSDALERLGDFAREGDRNALRLLHVAAEDPGDPDRIAAIKGLGSAAWAEESQAADILIGLAREATGPLRHAALEGLEGAAFHEHTGTLTLLVEVALRRGDPCRFVALNSLAPVAALGHVAARAAFDRAITDASDDDCDETGLSIQLAALLILEGAESTLAGATLS